MTVGVELIEGPATLYRVGHWFDARGLWYDAHGKETGLIHTVPNAVAAALPMQHHDIFRSDDAEWISVTDTQEALRNWFSVEDMKHLLERDFHVMAIDVQRYRRFHFRDHGYSHEVFSIRDMQRYFVIDPVRVYGQEILS